MTVVPFLIVAAVSGTASLLVRGRRGWSTLIAVVGLGLMTIAAGAIGSASAIQIGGTVLAGSEWLRLFALLGSVVGLLLVAIDVSAVHEPDVPGVLVLGLGAAVLALAIPDPGVAVVAATAGGLAGILVAAPIGATARAAFVGVRELRALAVAGTLAIVATAWLARPLDDLTGAPAAFGLAYLAFGLAVAIRFGAIPFHLWAARVADAAPGVALPLLMAWGPAAFAAVALTWIDRSVAPLVLPLGTERALIAAIGAVSVMLGMLAAWIQDDLEHVVGYTIAADAGFAVLSLGVLTPEVWEPARTWLLIFVVGRSAFAAWAVAVHGGFATRRLPDLAGWARRAPLLGVGLVIIAVASVGWPGLTIWETRAALAELALPGPLAVILTIAPIASLAIYGRILLMGLRQPSPAVRAGRGDWPGWPIALPRRRMVGMTALERGFERTAHALSATLDVLWVLPASARQNRMPLASTAVLLLAALAFAVGSGGLGVPEAARAVPAISQPGPGDGSTPGASQPAGIDGPEASGHGVGPSGPGPARSGGSPLPNDGTGPSGAGGLGGSDGSGDAGRPSGSPPP